MSSSRGTSLKSSSENLSLDFSTNGRPFPGRSESNDNALSSDQVKQRLKMHLLNRRKRASIDVVQPQTSPSEQYSSSDSVGPLRSPDDDDANVGCTARKQSLKSSKWHSTPTTGSNDVYKFYDIDFSNKLSTNRSSRRGSAPSTSLMSSTANSLASSSTNFTGISDALRFYHNTQPPAAGTHTFVAPATSNQLTTTDNIANLQRLLLLSQMAASQSPPVTLANAQHASTSNGFSVSGDTSDEIAARRRPKFRKTLSEPNLVEQQNRRPTALEQFDLSSLTHSVDESDRNGDDDGQKMDWESSTSDQNHQCSSSITTTTTTNSVTTSLPLTIDDNNTKPHQLLTNTSYQPPCHLGLSIAAVWAQFPIDVDFGSTETPSPSQSQASEAGDSLSKNDKLFKQTGLAFDPGMLEHQCLCGNSFDHQLHPENASRLTALLGDLFTRPLDVPTRFNKVATELTASCLANQSFSSQHNDFVQLSLAAGHISPIPPLLALCRLLRARPATEVELQLFHTKEHVAKFSTFQQSETTSMTAFGNQSQPVLCKLPCGGFGIDLDTVWHPKATSKASQLAVGQLLCLSHKVMSNELRNGFALVRPPGHHAEPDQAIGFCFFNAVAITALYLINNRLANRVMIVDWDIHHGNGTSSLASLHPNIVYVSLHRHDGGTFFPGTGSTNQIPSPNSQMTTAASASADAMFGGGSSRLARRYSDFASSLTNHPNPFSLNASVSQSSAATPTPPNALRRSSHPLRPPPLQPAPGCKQLVNVAWQSHTGDAGQSKNADIQSATASVRRSQWLQSCKFRAIGGSNNNLGSSSNSSSLDGQQRRTLTHSGSHSSGLGSSLSSPSQRPPAIDLRLSSFSSSSTDSSSSSLNKTSPNDDEDDVICLDDDNQAKPTSSSLLGLGDAEYLAAFRCVVEPIGREFQPDIILVSAGFDACQGHNDQMGGYNLTPGCFAWMTRQCMALAKNGRVVLTLEGGACIQSAIDSARSCINSLLLPTPDSPSDLRATVQSDSWQSACDWISPAELAREPCQEAVTSILATMSLHQHTGWHCFLDDTGGGNYPPTRRFVGQSFNSAMNTSPHASSANDVGKDRPTSLRLLDKVTATTSTSNTTSPLSKCLARLRMDQS